MPYSICCTYQQLKYSCPHRSNKQKRQEPYKRANLSENGGLGKTRPGEWAKSKKGKTERRQDYKAEEQERRYRKVGSNWQPWDSRQGGDIRTPTASLRRYKNKIETEIKTRLKRKSHNKIKTKRKWRYKNRPKRNGVTKTRPKRKWRYKTRPTRKSRRKQDWNGNGVIKTRLKRI